MNRLKGSTCYVPGPMDRCTTEQGNGWRRDIAEFLRARGIMVINPYEKPIDVALEDENFVKLRKQLMDKRDYDGVRSMMQPVRRLDLRCVDKSDFQVCNLDLDYLPCGTFEEIFTGNKQKKPIIIHCPQGKHNIPFWMFAVLPHEMFFDKWDDVKSYIIDVDDGHDSRHFGRWWFFDHEMLKTGTKL